MIEKIKKNLPLLALVLGVFAVLMVFCPWVGSGDVEEWAISGLNLIFGNDDILFRFGIGYFELGFSILALLTFLCIVGGVVLTILAEIMENKKTLFNLIAGICFGVAVIGLLLSVAAIAFNTEDFKDMMGAKNKEIREIISDLKKESEFTLGAGALIGALCSAAAACCTLIPAILEMNKMKANVAPVAPQQPMYGQPQQPMYGQPAQPVAPQQPVYGQPAPQQPMQPAQPVAPQQPMYGQPAPQQPMYGQPARPMQPTAPQQPQYPQYPQNGQNRPQ